MWRFQHPVGGWILVAPGRARLAVHKPKTGNSSHFPVTLRGLANRARREEATQGKLRCV